MSAAPDPEAALCRSGRSVTSASVLRIVPATLAAFSSAQAMVSYAFDVFDIAKIWPMRTRTTSDRCGSWRNSASDGRLFCAAPWCPVSSVPIASTTYCSDQSLTRAQEHLRNCGAHPGNDSVR
jgi:hypothetical protein